MNYADMRKELRSYYPKISDKKADDFREHCYKILNIAYITENEKRI